MIEGLSGGSTETKYARIPLWLYEKGVSLQAVATYGWLHGRYGHYERVVPSYKTLAKELGVSKGSVVAYVQELVDAGAVRITQRYDESGDRTTNRYLIAFNEPFPVGGQPTDHPTEEAGGQNTDHVDQGKHEKGGQPADHPGQDTDHGGQNTDQGGQPTGQRKKTSLNRRTEPDKEKPARERAGDPSGDPSSSEQKPKPGTDQDPEFTQWWSAYPKKVSKGAARQAWAKARRKTTFEALMSGLKRYVTEDAHVADGYIKNPSTWLNQECWDDEPARAPRRNGGALQPIPTHEDYNNGLVEVEI